MARTQQSTSNGNGAHPSYIPQQGRPPRKMREPVKTGLQQSLRTLKEINQTWAVAVVNDAEGVPQLASEPAAKLCGDQIRFLAAKLTGLSAEVDKRLEID